MIIRDWDLVIDADQILRGQGADPEIIRKRSPYLVTVAESALTEGFSLIKPFLYFCRVKVDSILHERILLVDQHELRGSLLTDHLASAEEVIVILCTISDQLENLASEIMEDDPIFALALDGLGSAAVESLANAACHKFETEAKSMGLETSIPLSPGMIGWSVDVGQPQIFNILPKEQIEVSLTSASLMLPRKSLSMVIGVGKQMTKIGKTCDYCKLSDRCQYHQL